MSASQAVPYLGAKIDYILRLTKELVEEHRKEWVREGMQLRSAIYHGPLAADEYDEEIQLLEIVEGLPYPSTTREPPVIHFASTREFPMFGHLKLRVMSPEEFTDRLLDGSLAALRSSPKRFLVDQDGFAKQLLD